MAKVEEVPAEPVYALTIDKTEAQELLYVLYSTGGCPCPSIRQALSNAGIDCRKAKLTGTWTWNRV